MKRSGFGGYSAVSSSLRLRSSCMSILFNSARHEKEQGRAANESVRDRRWILFIQTGPATIIACPPAPTPTIKRSPNCSAYTCTKTDRCCCLRGIEVILSRRNRAWVLCRGRNRERCRKAREPTSRARPRPGLLSDPLSFPGTCKCSPDRWRQLNLSICVCRFIRTVVTLFRVASESSISTPQYLFQNYFNFKFEISTRKCKPPSTRSCRAWQYICNILRLRFYFEISGMKIERRPIGVNIRVW